VTRTADALRQRRWDPVCRRCGGPVQPLPTDEEKKLEAGSVYAVTKRDHEDLCLVFGRAYGVRTVALRFFNVYGPRQSLSNPYTGVAAIFCSRLLAGERPLVYEDGRQTRDFVHVSDIVQALELALDTESAGDVALNVGTGATTTVSEVARTLAQELGRDLDPLIVNNFRHGDIRHCSADISRIRELLHYECKVSFREGMRELVGWISDSAPPTVDLTPRAAAELERHGLVV
jgi:dTDP-L-rhamnose 4-epimerase